MRLEQFIEQLIAVALAVRAAQPYGDGSRSRRLLAEPLTATELRILKLLPTSTCLQIAATLYISRNTVKTQLRSVYQKLGGVLARAGHRAGGRPASDLNHPRKDDDTFRRPLQDRPGGG
jgi:DNA-binding CsgD family transcriptional regulator